MVLILTNPEKLALRERFKIEIKEVRPICRSINETFKLDCTKETLALRRSSTNPFYGLEEANFEYGVLKDLNKRGDIEVITPFSGPKIIGDSLYFLTFWIDGQTASLSNSSPKEIGRYLGKLHRSLSGIKRSPSKPFSAGYIDDIICGSCQPYLDFKRYYPYAIDPSTKERLAYLEEIVEELRGNANVWGKKLNQKQLVHGDPRCENFILSGDGLVALDFQSMRQDYIVSDLGWCLTTDLCKPNGYEINLSMAEEFLIEYLDMNPLVDLFSFNEVTKLRHLRSLDTIYYFRLLGKKDKPELFETEEKSIKTLQDLDIKSQEIKRLIKRINR